MSIEKRSTYFRGRVITVTVDDVILPNGHRAQLELVHHPGGAAVVAIDAEGSRLPVAAVPPCGRRVDLGVARRKARTQRAAAVDRATRAHRGSRGERPPAGKASGKSFSSPGVFGEVLHLYLATDLEPASAEPEPSEVFEVHWMPFEEACVGARRHHHRQQNRSGAAASPASCAPGVTRNPAAIRDAVLSVCRTPAGNFDVAGNSRRRPLQSR